MVSAVCTFLSQQLLFVMMVMVVRMMMLLMQQLLAANYNTMIMHQVYRQADQ